MAPFAMSSARHGSHKIGRKWTRPAAGSWALETRTPRASGHWGASANASSAAYPREAQEGHRIVSHTAPNTQKPPERPQHLGVTTVVPAAIGVWHATSSHGPCQRRASSEHISQPGFSRS